MKFKSQKDSFSLAGENHVRISGRSYTRNGYFLKYDSLKDEVVYKPAQWLKKGLTDTWTGYVMRTADKEPFGSKSIQENVAGAFVDNGLYIRWISNGAIPFGDMLLDMYEGGYITLEQLMASCDKRELETHNFWAEFGGPASKESDDVRAQAINNSFDTRVPFDPVNNNHEHIGVTI